MGLLQIFSIISLILSLSGNLLINYKKKIGFWIWILSDISWIIVNFLGKPNYPQILMYIIYIIINIDGVVRWSKSKSKKGEVYDECKDK